MFKNHRKGLVVAFFRQHGRTVWILYNDSNSCAFPSGKVRCKCRNSRQIYSWFYFYIYALALFGGILADATKKYKTVIMTGIIIMFLGYVMMAIPGMSLTLTVVFLFTIALGNGLFKGNLQAVVGQMYDDPKYEKLRDKAYLLFTWE
ncbi:MAG: hypothetical protein IPF54_25555 [Draconibacterium sp.]|nr:hypothetical protein [Draconibacterium sp.]